MKSALSTLRRVLNIHTCNDSLAGIDHITKYGSLQTSNHIDLKRGRYDRLQQREAAPSQQMITPSKTIKHQKMEQVTPSVQLLGLKAYMLNYSCIDTPVDLRRESAAREKG